MSDVRVTRSRQFEPATGDAWRVVLDGPFAGETRDLVVVGIRDTTIGRRIRFLRSGLGPLGQSAPTCVRPEAWFLIVHGGAYVGRSTPTASNREEA